MTFETIFIITQICPKDGQKYFIKETLTNVKDKSYEDLYYIKSVKLTKDIYKAMRFDKYENAESNLKLLVLNGIYQIEKIFLSNKETKNLKTIIIP